MTALLLPPDETLAIPERVIVAPVVGSFQPAEPEVFTTEGEIVYEGQAVGVITSTSGETVVRSPFTGLFMGLLAHAGERVREGQPLAWLRVQAA